MTLLPRLARAESPSPTASNDHASRQRGGPVFH
jgi:hypothetical protein